MKEIEAPTHVPITTTTKEPATATTLTPIKTTTPKHVQQARSIPPAPPVAPIVAPPTVQPAPGPAPVPLTPVQPPRQPLQPQPFNNYLYPQQNFQQPQQQLYYTQVFNRPLIFQQNMFQAPFYGQQTQNFWGQQNQFAQQYGAQPQQPQQVPQQLYNQFGYSTPLPANQQPYYQQQLPTKQQPQPQQPYYPVNWTNSNTLLILLFQQNVPQQQSQQQFNQQPYYSTNAQQQISVPRQQVQQPTPLQQRPTASQKAVYQQGSARPTASPHPQSPPQKSVPYVQPSGNTNQVVHYYHDGKQVVQQIIPKQIAANGNFPLNGPFRSQTTGVTDPVEYQRRQRALQQAYHQPQTRGAVATKSR